MFIIRCNHLLPHPLTQICWCSKYKGQHFFHSLFDMRNWMCAIMKTACQISFRHGCGIFKWILLVPCWKQKKKICLFALFGHVSWILVLWPWQLHCLALKQKQEVTPGNNFCTPPKIIYEGHLAFTKSYPGVSASARIDKCFEHESSWI